MLTSIAVPSDWFERVVEPARLADRMSWCVIAPLLVVSTYDI